MQTYLNQAGVPLSVAVYLATDHYDYVPGAISATSLLKPAKQRILKARLKPEQTVKDISGLVKSRMGTSIHDGIEKAWLFSYKQALKSLNYPDHVIDRVIVNSSQLLKQHGYDTAALEEAGVCLDHKAAHDNAIPVYMEIRSFRKMGEHTISGKFDFAAEGRVEDFKSTSVYTWTNDTKSEDYKLQGSIYRWLNPKIITRNEMAIQFFFTDWSRAQAKTSPKYPQQQTQEMTIPLLSLDDTEQFIHSKLAESTRLWDADESNMPMCTDKELWRTEPKFKYYKNPAKRSRSTKNFDSLAEANAQLIKDGNVGIVIEAKGEVKACNYCDAFPICRQKDIYVQDGTLKPL